MESIQQPTRPLHIGIDVAKSTLQADLQGKSLRFANTRAGHGALLAALPDGAFIVLEATGSYHLEVTARLQSAGIPVAVANPARVRQFARARGTLAKTDPVDAALLSAFGVAFDPPPAPPRDAEREQLAEFVNLRDLLVAEITRWGNLGGHQQSAAARKIAAVQAAAARKALAAVEKDIARLIAESASLAPAAVVLRECKGVGPVTGAVLLARMTELGRLGRRQIVALAGLAPCANDSGKHQGKRMTRGGRPRVKRALYLAALSALRHHPALRATYRALRAKGKPAKVAIVAIARKLLVMLNAKLKEHYAAVAAAAA